MIPIARHVIEFERLSPEVAREEYPVLWYTAQQALPGLSDEHLALVVSLAVDLCPHCYAEDRWCSCSRDD